MKTFFTKLNVSVSRSIFVLCLVSCIIQASYLGQQRPQPVSPGYSSFYPYRYMGVSQCPKGTYECQQPVFSMTQLQESWVQNRTKCIPSEKVCDQVKDCPNRDDESEQLCSCQSEPGYFRCRGVESKCIPPAWTCDKVQDCPHGDDEIDSSCSARLVHSCLGPQNQAYSYPSFNNKTIPVSWKCDGEQDCPKGDDEKFCPTAYPKAKCSEGQYNCLESSTCLDKSLLCNHVADCPQQDDERDCKSTLPDSENITLNTVPTKA